MSVCSANESDEIEDFLLKILYPSKEAFNHLYKIFNSKEEIERFIKYLQTSVSLSSIFMQ
jgi:hypothetical protein